MPVIEHIISLIAPHHCLACSAEGSLLCEPCSLSLSPAEPRCYKCLHSASDGVTCKGCAQSSSLVSVVAAVAYTDVAKSIVHHLKFERASAAAKPIAHLMEQRLRLPENCVITYAPTANDRVRTRGYDQSRRIARKLAQAHRIPFYPLLARTSSARQVGASAEQRRTQMSHAFRAISPQLIQHKHVIIIDDVITTGSTLEAAAAVLSAAGARRVDALVFAQA